MSFPPPPPYSPGPEYPPSSPPGFVTADSNQPMAQINSQQLPPPPQFQTFQNETTVLPFGSSQQSSQLRVCDNFELQIMSYASLPPAPPYNTEFRYSNDYTLSSRFDLRVVSDSAVNEPLLPRAPSPPAASSAAPLGPSLHSPNRNRAHQDSSQSIGVGVHNSGGIFGTSPQLPTSYGGLVDGAHASVVPHSPLSAPSGGLARPRPTSALFIDWGSMWRYLFAIMAILIIICVPMYIISLKLKESRKKSYTESIRSSSNVGLSGLQNSNSGYSGSSSWNSYQDMDPLQVGIPNRPSAGILVEYNQ